MRKFLGALGWVALTVVAGARLALAADGPGIANMTFQTTDLWKEISLFGASNFGGGPTGSNVALLTRGYLMTLGTNDSGVAPGVYHVFNVSNPRLPVQVASFNGAGTNILREQHAMPIAMVGGRDLLAAPTTQGIQIWDVTDPTAVTMLSALTLAGAQGGDYDNAVWMLTWTWPYLFAGGTQNGVYIIDTRNPAQPTLLNRIPIQAMGNFRVGAVFAMGNQLVAMTHEAECAQTALNCANPSTINQISVLDVGDPMRPMLLATSRVPFAFYSGLTLGDRVYLGGDFGQVGIMSWSPSGFRLLSQKSFATCPNVGNACAAKGGYCSYQDGFIFCGQSEMGFIKLDVHDAANEANPTMVGHGDLTDPAADTDFSSVFGNLLYIGNDHGSGAGLVPHDTRPDTFPPRLIRTFPEDGAIMQPLGTRVTIHLSDVIDGRSVTAASFVVRPLGGAPLTGNYSMSSINAISFGANNPLQPNTTYEITLPQGGVRDVMQNPIAGTITARFSTGATVDTTPTPPPDGGVPAGTGGSGVLDGGAANTGGSAGMAGGRSGTSTGGQTGALSTGGSSGTGGTPSAAGTGGLSGPPGTGGQSPRPSATGSSSSGCGCQVDRGGPASGLAALVFGAFAVMGARTLRRGKRRRRNVDT
jgi:Bacterial Ig-like domain